MGYVTLEYFRRGTPPDIYLTYSYECIRDGADVRIRFKVKMSGVGGSSYNSNWFKQKITVDSAVKLNSVTIKESGVSQWAAFEYETGWYTIANKTSGALSLVFTSTTNDSDYSSSVSKTYSVEVPPAMSALAEVTDFALEDGFSVSFASYDNSFTHKLRLSLPEQGYVDFEPIISDEALHLTDEDLLFAYRSFGEEAEFESTLTLYTYSAESLIGADERSVNISLKGCMRAKAAGSFIRAMPFINIQGEYRRCLAYIKQGGSWKKGI